MLATDTAWKCVLAFGGIKQPHHYHQALIHSLKFESIKYGMNFYSANCHLRPYK